MYSVLRGRQKGGLCAIDGENESEELPGGALEASPQSPHLLLC